MDFDYSGLYVCDPQKNTLCNKRNCGNPCTMTSHKEFAKDGGADMNVQRAIEILNPAHREHYESIEPIDEACRMGIAALSYRVRKKPEYLPARPAPTLACKRCGSVKHLHNADRLLTGRMRRKRTHKKPPTFSQNVGGACLGKDKVTHTLYIISRSGAICKRKAAGNRYFRACMG